MRFAVLVAALVASTAAHAKFDPTCTEDKVTQENLCFQSSEIKVDQNGIRTAPLYKGGPKLVERTSFTIAVNCKTDVIHLKDRLGVSFGGSGPGGGTHQSRNLLALMCYAPLPGKHK